MNITVEGLLKWRFLDRPQESKSEIVSKGKPRPLLKLSVVSFDDEKGVVKTEVFDPIMYDQVPWLTGCEVRQIFYCWPCLLFRPEKELWKVADLAFLSEGIFEHEKCVLHIQAASKLKKYSSEHFKVMKVDLNDDQFRQTVRKNREILKLLTVAVCSVVARDQPVRGEDSNQSKIEPEMCVKVLNLLKLYDSRLLKHINHAIETIQRTPRLLDDLVDALTNVLKLAVMKEVKMSTYASLIVSDHSTSRTKSQFSLVLRYIKEGEVCERFLGFINLLHVKSTDMIYDIIRNTIAAFGIEDKFIAYSFDGGILKLSKLTELNRLLQMKYLPAFFVPCYFQGIKYILRQSLSVHKELTPFLKIMDVMEAYFQVGSQQQKVLEHFLFLNASEENSNWCVKAPFIAIVFRYRMHFIEALEFIVKNYTEWSADDNIKARCFLEFLGEFHNIVLLHILSPLYEHIMRLDEALRNSSLEMEFRSDMIPSIVDHILAEKYKFEKYFTSSIKEMNETNHDVNFPKRLKVDYKDQTVPYYSLHCTIIDHVQKEILLRFSKVEDLGFCSLVNVHCADIPQQKLDFCYRNLNSAPGHHFGSQELSRNEINVQLANTEFRNKNAYDLLRYFEKENLKGVFKCTNKLLEFVLTMPFRTPVQDGDSSKLQKIKRFSYSKVCIRTPGDASILHVESEFLRDLQSGVFFYDDTIQKFYEMNKTVELMYGTRHLNNAVG